MSRSSAAAMIGVVVLWASGCTRDLHSTGTCDGAIGRVTVDGAVGAGSAYQVDWAGDGRTLLKLDCAGKFVFVAEWKSAPSATSTTHALPSDDPSCATGSSDAGAAIVPPTCGSGPALRWTIVAPKSRPRLARGELQTALQERGGRLRGTADLTFEDGTAARVDFALDYGTVTVDDLQGVDVSAIPGRLTFSGQ